MEDLWAFNDERVARAIFAAHRPIISGVGHEVDFTIADFVADLRAPTPSAAAELAVPDRAELQPILLGAQARLAETVREKLERRQQQVDALARSLAYLSPRARLDSHRQRVDVLAVRLAQLVRRRQERSATRLQILTTRLEVISPLATLARGYAIVRDENGRIVRRAAQVTAGDRLAVQVADGTFGVQVD